MVIFYQNNLEGSFDNAVRELEQLPQRVFCVTVWDTPPPPTLGSIEFHFPAKFGRGEICPDTRVPCMCLSVKLLFARILLELYPPTFEY